MIVCLFVPRFAFQIAQSSGIDQPQLILINAESTDARIIAVSPEAEAAGAKVGMTWVEAAPRFPEAIFLSGTAPEFRDEAESLLQSLSVYTQYLELDERSFPQTAVIYLDIGSLKDDDLQRQVIDIFFEVKQRNLNASVGVARGKFPAAVAAQKAELNHYFLVREGQEAAFLAKLLITRLPLSPELAARLSRLNVKTLGDFASLPDVRVKQELGEEAYRFYQIANGCDERRIAPIQAPPAIEPVHAILEEPLVDKTRWMLTIVPLAQEFMRNLSQNAMVCRQFGLILTLDDGRTRERLSRIRAYHSPAEIAREMNLMIDGLSLQAPITEIEISFVQ